MSSVFRLTAVETANFTCTAMNQLTHTVIQGKQGGFPKKFIHFVESQRRKSDKSDRFRLKWSNVVIPGQVGMTYDCNGSLFNINFDCLP